MKHTIILTELQKARFNQLEQQIQQLGQQIQSLQAQGTMRIETIVDCAGLQLDPNGQWHRLNDNEIVVDVLDKNQDTQKLN